MKKELQKIRESEWLAELYRQLTLMQLSEITINPQTKASLVNALEDLMRETDFDDYSFPPGYESNLRVGDYAAFLDSADRMIQTGDCSGKKKRMKGLLRTATEVFPLWAKVSVRERKGVII